jgi:signal transduction histidine kinase
MRSLTTKLILAFLIVGLTGTAMVALFVGLATSAEFGNFLFDQGREDFVSQLAEYYQGKGSWEGVETLTPFPGLKRPPGGFGGIEEGGPFTLVDEAGRVVVPGPGHHFGGMMNDGDFGLSEPILVEDEEVGRLIVGRNAFRESVAARSFMQRVLQVLVFGAIGATFAAVLIGIVLARTLTKPLDELTKATQAVTEGYLEQKVPVRSNDELGQLAQSFNQMNENLFRSRESRRHMTADIAHELRTPLSVILGHTEGIRDGVIAPSQDAFEIIHDETLRLSALVEDLRMLTLAEAGELPLEIQSYPPERLINDTVAAYTPRAKREGIIFESKAAPSLSEIKIDPGRIIQVLGNLIDNALRYTPQGGKITLEALNVTGAVEFHVCDTGPGVTPEELDHLFDRFYRGDKSRHREKGGSGLGLAIAKSIVESHGGKIRAESSPGEGLQVIVELPD